MSHFPTLSHPDVVCRDGGYEGFDRRGSSTIAEVPLRKQSRGERNGEGKGNAWERRHYELRRGFVSSPIRLGGEPEEEARREEKSHLGVNEKRSGFRTWTKIFLEEVRKCDPLNLSKNNTKFFRPENKKIR